jgi:radical SAM protein with 4Fe4S-binding SPASM domain
LSEVDVSLDFADSDQHCRFRGNDKAHDWALETIAMCTQQGLPTTIVIMGIDSTMHPDNLSGIFDLATRHGCFVRLNIFRPNASQGLPPLSYNSLRTGLDYVVRNHSVVSIADPLFSALIVRKKAVDASGATSLRILPDGSITPSTYLISPEWRLAHASNADLGTDTFSRLLMERMQNTVPNECESCSLVPLCSGGAKDRRIIWYGSLAERDPYCPRRHEGVSSFLREDINIVQRNGGPGIHDGYLPTMIFAPTRG